MEKRKVEAINVVSNIDNIEENLYNGVYRYTYNIPILAIPRSAYFNNNTLNVIFEYDTINSQYLERVSVLAIAINTEFDESLIKGYKYLTMAKGSNIRWLIYIKSE